MALEAAQSTNDQKRVKGRAFNIHNNNNSLLFVANEVCQVKRLSLPYVLDSSTCSHRLYAAVDSLIPWLLISLPLKITLIDSFTNHCSNIAIASKDDYFNRKTKEGVLKLGVPGVAGELLSKSAVRERISEEMRAMSSERGGNLYVS